MTDPQRVDPPPILLREVGPRDGFQSEKSIPTDVKVELIDLLARTGVPRIELTSFVRADVIPQFADAATVLERVTVPPGVSRSVLIPNERGLDAALAHRRHFDEIGVFLSASETHNRKNVNRSVLESLRGLVAILDRAGGEALRREAIIATSFGCPYEGRVAADDVFSLATSLVAAGADEIAFGDTTGMANPRQVATFFERALAELPGVLVTAHFHNTRGQGLANVLAALDVGVTSFESSFGELGGCPVPAGATGNIATEDLVSMLEEMGLRTGVDLLRVLDASRRAQAVVGRELGAHTLVAGPVCWEQR